MQYVVFVSFFKAGLFSGQEVADSVRHIPVDHVRIFFFTEYKRRDKGWERERLRDSWGEKARAGQGGSDREAI